MSAVYTVFTSPNHAPIPNHLPTLIVTPHGQPHNILYSYLHTNFNAENYLLTPSPQGDLCVAKLFPPPRHTGGSSASDPGHGSSSSRSVRCEASRNLKWTITNTGVLTPIYKLSLPAQESELPLFQISKPNPKSPFWSMFYFAYAGHLIPPKRIEFGKIQKNPPGPGGGGTRISITGKTPEEKAVWQTLGEGNEDCVEWVVLCAALNLLDDEIIKAAEKAQQAASPTPQNIPRPIAQSQTQPDPSQARQPAAAQAAQRSGSIPAPATNGRATAPPNGRGPAPARLGLPQPSPAQRPHSANAVTNGTAGTAPPAARPHHNVLQRPSTNGGHAGQTRGVPPPNPQQPYPRRI